MLGSNTRISIGRITTDSVGQKPTGAAHASGIEAYEEPSSGELLMASDAPIGQTWTFYTSPLSVPEVIQISDLLTDSSARTFRVVSIQEYENHLVLVATRIEPDTTAP